LIRLNNGHFDEDEMALEWVPYCNGMTIFPKLPLYLRWHHKNWLRNEETRAAIKKAAYKQGDSFIKTFHSESTTVLATAFPVSWPLAVVPAETRATAALEAGIFHVLPLAPVIVGGISTTVIAIQPLSQPPSKKTRGERGVDIVPRKQRTYYWCSRGILPGSATCPGRFNRKNCLYFDKTGNKKW
jgi:hypothetical protein